MSAALVVAKAEQDVEDPASRLAALLSFFDARLRAQFLEVVEAIVDSMPIAELQRLVRLGRISEVYRLIDSGAKRLAKAFTDAYFGAGAKTSSFLSGKLEVVFDFDQVNERAVRAARRLSLDAVVQFADEQKAAVREAIAEGVTRGANPIEQAREIRGAIGLTTKQQRFVANYRRSLERLDADALRRELRDRRFDPTIERAIQNRTPLTKAQIDKMVERYRARWLKFRSETIARTEALSAVHAANHEAFEQAYEGGVLDPRTVTREWNTAKDSRVRDSHEAMHGQKRGAREPFISGLGNALMFPGDPAAPAADRIKCRCSVGTRIRIASLLQPAGAAS